MPENQEATSWSDYYAALADQGSYSALETTSRLPAKAIGALENARGATACDLN